MNKPTPSPAIRVTRTPEVARALAIAKRRFPTLTDPEIIKLGLATLTNEVTEEAEKAETRATAAHSAGTDYLDDPAEDIYQPRSSKKSR